MTDLVAPSWMYPKRPRPVEHWHAEMMRGGLIANVIVARADDGSWTARTQLRDRSLLPVGETCICAPFDTREGALHAGTAAALRLHKAAVGTHEVREPARAATLPEPVGGYQSAALQRFALGQKAAQRTWVLADAPQPGSEAEMIA